VRDDRERGHQCDEVKDEIGVLDAGLEDEESVDD
jgi:hypothetical protein